MESLSQSKERSDQDKGLRQIDSAAWAVFFIWVGVVMLAGLPWDAFIQLFRMPRQFACLYARQYGTEWRAAVQ